MDMDSGSQGVAKSSQLENEMKPQQVGLDFPQSTLFFQIGQSSLDFIRSTAGGNCAHGYSKMGMEHPL